MKSTIRLFRLRLNEQVVGPWEGYFSEEMQRDAIASGSTLEAVDAIIDEDQVEVVKQY